MPLIKDLHVIPQKLQYYYLFVILTSLFCEKTRSIHIFLLKSLFITIFISIFAPTESATLLVRSANQGGSFALWTH